MPIIIPPDISTKLADIEAALTPFDSFELFGQLNQLANSGNPTDDERLGYQAEVLGFQFVPMRGNESSPRGSYFGPFFSYTTAAGEMINSPESKSISPEVIEYWKVRSKETPHPSLQARYADLALDIGRIFNHEHPDKVQIELPRELYQIAIDGYIRTIEENLSLGEHQTWVFLKRAADLALYIQDTQRITQVKLIAFAHVRKQSDLDRSRSWWDLDNLVWERKDLEPNEAERNELIGWLEDALAASSNIHDKNRFSPHDALNAADLLQRWYGKLKQPDRGASAIRKAGAAFEELAIKTNALTASAWLQDLSFRYKNANLMEDVARVNAMIKARAPEAEGEMTQHEIKVEIPKDEMDQWLNELFSESLETSLARIAFNLMHTPEKIKEIIENSAKNAPLQAHLPIAIMGNDGFTQAKIGSITDDMPGRTIYMTSTLIGHSAPWLNFAFDHAKEKWQLDAEKLFAWLTQSPLFKSNRSALLKIGIDAWFSENYEVAVHLLVPQIESALREWLILMGESAMRPTRDQTGFEAMGMGAILGTESFKNKVNPTIKLHLAALFTNTKGLNLRNRLAHGIIDPEILHRGTANWVIHALLAVRTFSSIREATKITDQNL